MFVYESLQKKRLEAGPLSHVETWMKILCKYSKKPVTVCLIIFGSCSSCHCLVLPSGARLSVRGGGVGVDKDKLSSGGVSTLALLA